MLTLDYRLDPIGAAEAREVDMGSADATSLRYRLFPGDVIIRGGGVDLSTRWSWVQVFDFAMSLIVLKTTLERDQQARFEFTESNAALDFRIENDDVCISSTYANGFIRVRVSEFHDEVERFAARLVRDLCNQHPGLSLNPEFTQLAG